MQKDVIDKLTALMTAAFGLVAALAWNDAIKSLFAPATDTQPAGVLYFMASYGPWAYAVLVTILAVVMIIWIGRIAGKTE
ncbi:DUF5654 family protein [archaeon]|nr:DUF5654 family protein [archaeon]